MIGELFVATASKAAPDASLVHSLWGEIEKQYSHRSRRYHTLVHLEKMTAELEVVKEQIEDFEAIVFAIVYHDIVYKATKKDNEEKSAELARKRLTSLSYSAQATERIVGHILATKAHQKARTTTRTFLRMLIYRFWVLPGRPTRNIISRSEKNMPSIRICSTSPAGARFCNISWTCRRSLKRRFSIGVTKGKPGKTWSGN